MKKMQLAGLVILLLLNLLIFNGSAMAGKWLLGVSLGYAFGDAGSAELNDTLADRGISAAITDIDDTRSMMQFFAGYEYTPRWGVELGYVDLGDVSASINGTISGINNYFDLGQDVYPQTATGFQLSGVYRYPLSGRLQFTGRLGLFNWETDYTLETPNISQDVNESGTDIVYGIGLETGSWIYQGGIVGQVNWDFYDINGENVSVLAVGVSYRF